MKNPMIIKLASGVLAICLALALAGCADDGDDGADGVNGVDGINGVDGANGAGQVVTLQHLASTVSRGFGSDVAAAEIVAFDSASKRIFTVNADIGKVDVFNATDPSAPVFQQSIDVKALLVANGKVSSTDLIGNANSIDIHGNLAAVAVEASPKTAPGWVLFINVSTLAYVNAVTTGALPDMLTFTPDGSRVIVACEGEPEDYTVDPEGSIDIIRVSDFTRQTAGFSDFNSGGPRAAEISAKVRIYGKIVNADGTFNRNSTVSEDLEPEYVAVSEDSQTAYVTLQENNAIAIVDLASARVARIFALGFKDYRLPSNALDASDRDTAVNIRNWPVYGMYQPDAIAAYRVNGSDYLVTANEGDSRADWGIEQVPGDETTNLNLEEFRVKDLTLDPVAFPDWATLQSDAQLGRLKITTKLGDSDGDGDYDKLYALGARSFAIWDAATGELVFESGSAIEQITAQKYGLDFNNNHDDTKGDSRSDDKGPEPEGIILGIINGHTYAFVALERMGGILVYDISNPYAPDYVQYLNNRTVTLPSTDPKVGDLGPEGLIFVEAAHSPKGKPLIIVGNEVSGTTAIYQVNTTLLQQ